MSAANSLRWVKVLALGLPLVTIWLAVGAVTNPAATEPAIPNVVILDQLSKTEKLFGPVPFDHKTHADMSRMQSGCTTCHHRQPNATTQNVATIPNGTVLSNRQEDAAKHPACRTCHPPERQDIRQPGLKGAYHRQCLNCHREWAHANNCSVCHLPLKGNGGIAKVPTPDDVMSRMHPPLQEPQVRMFRTKFEPASGPNVLFRHKEHIESYGIKCVTCHKTEDTCARCHDNNAAQKLVDAREHLPLDRTWDVVHRRCSSCHQRDENSCTICHFKDGRTAPGPFAHASTGQLLDTDHANLRCTDCHNTWQAKAAPSCGTASCHSRSTTPITFPDKRPGGFVARPTSQPTTKPVSWRGEAQAEPRGSRQAPLAVGTRSVPATLATLAWGEQ